MTSRLPMVLLIGLALPFVHKPVHVDDANFLAMARAAAIEADGQPWLWAGRCSGAFRRH